MLKSLRDIRNTHVLVLHPKDRERDELVAHIRRIGCQVEAQWPPQDEILPHVKIAFVLFRDDAMTAALLKALSHRPGLLALVGIIEFESPAMIEAAVNAGTSAVVTKPIRAFGLLTSIIIACNQTASLQAKSERIGKLEARLAGLKRIEQAKSVLMARRQISEQEAYDMIRSYAMSKRLTMEAVCSSIIDASEIFGA